MTTLVVPSPGTSVSFFSFQGLEPPAEHSANLIYLLLESEVKLLIDDFGVVRQANEKPEHIDRAAYKENFFTAG
jgi:hypothetical protein